MRKKRVVQHLPALLERDGAFCQYCKVPVGSDFIIEDEVWRFEQKKWTTPFGKVVLRGINNGIAFPVADHVIPWCISKDDSLDNLTVCCSECNCLKGDRPVEWLLTKLGKS